MNIKYQVIETDFSDLQKDLEHIFSTSEISEVSDFIDHGEYGLALDTVVDIITEERKIINNSILNQIIDLSIIMDLDFHIVRNKLSDYIA